MELFHSYLENHKEAPPMWRRFYRTCHGLVEESGELGSRGAGRSPSKRLTHRGWDDEKARKRVATLTSQSWEKWPDPYKDEIKALIRHEKAKMKEEKERAENERIEREKEMLRRPMGGKGRLRGL